MVVCITYNIHAKGVRMDGMVTARMPIGKKEAGVAVLADLGVSASQAINGLFDYLIENGSLPFERARKQGSVSPDEIACAAAWIDGISLPAGNRFATASDDDIRRERLSSKGLL